MPATRLLRRSLGAAVVGVLAVAAPAVGHPFVAGGELPVDSLATLTLTMAHGCGGDDGSEEEPTTEVALEVPDWLRIVEVAPTPGYTAELETGDAGAVETVVWTAEGEGEPAPTFDLDVVASGEPGEERHLAVFQGCATGSYRWIGTPDEPADDPAIAVTLTAADPDRPAPPPDEADAGDQGGDPAQDPEEPTDAPTAVPEDPTDGATGDAPTEGAASLDEEDTDGASRLLVIAGVAVVAVAVAAVLARRRRTGRTGTDGGA